MSDSTYNDVRARVPEAAIAPAVADVSPGWRSRLQHWTEGFLVEAWQKDPELGRRARLIVRFGFLGFIFGVIYAAFYLAIGHHWGARIIMVCSLGFVGVPFLLRYSGSLSLGGNLLLAILTAGFTALCGVEGGLNGHAIAWLVSVPLCALLLVGKDSARYWVVISLLAGSAVIAASLLGLNVAPTYDPAWHSLVSALGYLGLIAFMFILGMIFETERDRAFRRMKETLVKLETSNEQLIGLNNEKNEFLGIAAHDLKNPLTTIIGNAELIGRLNQSEKTVQMSQNIVQASTRMVHLIKNLLDANAIEQGRFTSQIGRFDLAALMSECVSQNQMAASRKGINLSVAAAGPVWGKADRTATVQILDNLLSNAIKYSPFNSTVYLTVASEQGRVTVSVRDEGPGVSEADQAKMFQKFTRLSAQPTGGESSNGLGLSIVKRLAEAMSGTVACRSKPGAGATFTLSLPAWEGPA